MSDIKVVAVDMDGTLCRSDTTINEERLRPILARLYQGLEPFKGHALKQWRAAT